MVYPRGKIVTSMELRYMTKCDIQEMATSNVHKIVASEEVEVPDFYKDLTEFPVNIETESMYKNLSNFEKS